MPGKWLFPQLLELFKDPFCSSVEKIIDLNKEGENVMLVPNFKKAA